MVEFFDRDPTIEEQTERPFNRLERLTKENREREQRLNEQLKKWAEAGSQLYGQPIGGHAVDINADVTHFEFDGYKMQPGTWQPDLPPKEPPPLPKPLPDLPWWWKDDPVHAPALYDVKPPKKKYPWQKEVTIEKIKKALKNES